MAKAPMLSAAGFSERLEQLRASVTGIQAIVLMGPDGIMLDSVLADRRFDLDGFATEYAMLLRIARHTSEDMGAGDLVEHIAISDRCVTIARCFASEFFLILVSEAQDQIGRARYELKRAAADLERRIHIGS